MPTIRAYRPADREACYDVCIRTGDAGADATALYRDPRILPEIFTGPYVDLEPEFAFVLADEADTAIGYIIGTPDTRRFVAAYRRSWLPVVGPRYPEGGGEGPDAERIAQLHHPEWMLDGEVPDRYPAHLHIDLLPQAQGQGAGRAMVAAFLAAVRAAGAPRVHLGMAAGNSGALAFYQRLGFHRLDGHGTPAAAPSGALLLGRSTEP